MLIPAEALLPQRAPFILIDGLLDAQPEMLTATFYIAPGHVMVKNKKLTTGGLLENMAQTMAAGAGYAASQTGQQPAKGFLVAVKNLNIVTLPAIGQTVITELIIGSALLNIRTATAKVYLNNEVIASCSLTVVVE